MTHKKSSFEFLKVFFWRLLFRATDFLANLEGRFTNWITDLKTKGTSSLILIPITAIGILWAFISLLSSLVFLSIKHLFLNFIGIRPRHRSFWEFLFSWIIFALIIIVLPFYFTDFRIYQMIQIAAFLMICLGLNILVGYTGQLSLGQDAFVLIGAYTTAILFNGEYLPAMPFYIALLAGGVLSCLLGIFLGLPSIRLKGPYLALITLSFSMLISVIMRSSYFTKITGGATGIAVNALTVPESLSWMSDLQWQYTVIVAPSLILLLLADLILRNHRIGRAFYSMSQSDELASSVGIGIFKYKLLAFGLSAFFAGIGGGFFAIIIGAMQPKSFTVYDSIGYLTATLVGGPGSILGSFFAAIYLSLQSEVAQFLGSFIANGEALAMTLFGGVLVLAVIFFPGGIAGMIRELIEKYHLAKPIRYQSYRKLSFHKAPEKNSIPESPVDS